MGDLASVESEALAVVKSFYRGGAEGRITDFASSLADDFELLVPDYLPWGGRYDKAGYVAILPQVATTLDFSRCTYESLTVQSNHVVALIRIEVRGTTQSILISEHWDIEAGKAKRLLVAYFDPKVLLDRANSQSA